MAACYDQWARDYPDETFLIGGHSCYQKARAGACESVIESCAATCGLCSEDGASLADVIAARRHAAAVAIPFESSDGKLVVRGKPFNIKGINMFGGESSNMLPMGLDKRSLDSLLLWIKQTGFNALRLPFNHAAVLRDARVTNFDSTKNPDFVDASYIDALVTIVQAAARHNILVLPACHRMEGRAHGMFDLKCDNDLSKSFINKCQRIHTC